MSDLIPTEDNNALHPEKVNKPLKLVVSNHFPIQEMLSFQARSTVTGFTAEIRRRSPYLYALVARDPFHYLDCTLILEIEENLAEYPQNSAAVTCKFPPISDGKLNDFIEEDETLLGMILVQFQMKILEQLLLFCAAHKASTLMIQVGEAQAKGMGIYAELVTYEDKVPTKGGNLVQMTIPANPKNFEMWVNYVDEVNQKFRQTLWQDQSINPTIRDYLKANPRLSIVR